MRRSPPATPDLAVRATLVAADRPAQVQAVEDLIRWYQHSPRAMVVFTGLAAAGPAGRKLALEFVARTPLPLPSGITLVATPLLQDRSLPLPLRLAVAGKLIATLPDKPESAGVVIRSLTAGLSQARRLERLLQLQSRVETSVALDRAVAEAEGRVRLRCPKCNKRFSRRNLILHLWRKHRALYEHGRVKDGGPAVEAAVQTLAGTNTPDGIDRVHALASSLFAGVKPGQVHQAILSRLGAAPDETEALARKAAEHDAGLCPACFAEVPDPQPPLPPPLTLAGGRLSGDGFRVEVRDGAAGRVLIIDGPDGEVYAGRDVAGTFSPRRAGVWAATPLATLAMLVALFLPRSLASPLAGAWLVGTAAVLLYLAVRFVRTPLPAVNRRAVDAAWAELVPIIGRSPAAIRFLIRLCRTSLSAGSHVARARPVFDLADHAEVLARKGGEYLHLLAAARVLSARDAGRIGKDWVPALVALFEPFFRGELPSGYAEAAAACLIECDEFDDPVAARLRPLLAAAAFEAGLTAADLIAVARFCPAVGKLTGAEQDRLLALWHAVWLGRATRPWAAVGPADTVFDTARGSPGFAGRLLAEYPDLLLAFRFDARLDEQLGPVLVRSRGVSVGGRTVADADAEVGIVADRGAVSLRFGPFLFPLERANPRAAEILQLWLHFREHALVRAAEEAERAEATQRATQLLIDLVTSCPLCGTRCIVKRGRLDVVWSKRS